MLKKRVLKRLLPLLFSFCFVFSGFLSVKTFAYNLYDRYPFLNPSSLSYYYNNFNSVVSNYITEPLNDYNFVYQSSIASASNVDSVSCVFEDIHDVPVNTDIYDYYLVGSYTAQLTSISSFTFFPSRMVVRTSDHNHVGFDLPISDVKFYHTDGSKDFGFSYSCKVDLSQYTNITNIIMYSGTSGLTMPANLAFQHTVISLPKDLSSGDAAAAIVNAINSQTNQLSSDIGQAADDVQQSIEDQYNGDPETEFSVDDVITQHNEKMGVLSFGSDVMLQFLDMFQSANVGAAELTLPGFNITVENVEYSVWPDYSFNFEQLNEWVPDLMSVIRVMLPAFVWLMVLRYCIKVFEDNFLAK